VPPFTTDQVSLAAVEPSGAAVYAVDVARGRDRGRVRISSRRHRSRDPEAWIAAELNRRVARFGIEIVDAALSRPLELD
jgi:hypothetical protein